MKILQNIPLAPLTTFKVGGPARYFLEATSEDDVALAAEHARVRNLPLFVLGGGSNLVVADAGWPGLVVKIAIRGVTEHDDQRIFEVGAGEDWDQFVAMSVARGCSGIETMSGIPGTVGGTPVQNVGAYGQEVSETIVSVRTIDLQTMRIRELNNTECGFKYRTSIFNSTERGRYAVLSVKFALSPGGKPHLAYADLQKYFATRRNGRPSLADTRNAVREIRLSKAMLIVPDDDDCRSAGSFFKNPIVDEKQYEAVAELASKLEVGGNNNPASLPPKYPAGDGKVKISAAWLVEHAGFPKGYVRGAVGISRKHALAIVNRGRATAADIVSLKDVIQGSVRDTFGVELQPEPVFVGFDPDGSS